MPMDLAPFIDGRAIHQIYAGETRSCHERNKSRVRGNFAPLNPLRFKATPKNVIPAKAGIHKFLTLLDSRLRGSDKLGIIRGSLKSYEFRI